jgi:hypothetical protein
MFYGNPECQITPHIKPEHKKCKSDQIGISTNTGRDGIDFFYYINESKNNQNPNPNQHPPKNKIKNAKANPPPASKKLIQRALRGHKAPSSPKRNYQFFNIPHQKNPTQTNPRDLLLAKKTYDDFPSPIALTSSGLTPHHSDAYPQNLNTDPTYEEISDFAPQDKDHPDFSEGYPCIYKSIEINQDHPQLEDPDQPLIERKSWAYVHTNPIEKNTTSSTNGVSNNRHPSISNGLKQRAGHKRVASTYIGSTYSKQKGGPLNFYGKDPDRPTSGH